MKKFNQLKHFVIINLSEIRGLFVAVLCYLIILLGPPLLYAHFIGSDFWWGLSALNTLTFVIWLVHEEPLPKRLGLFKVFLPCLIPFFLAYFHHELTLQKNSRSELYGYIRFTSIKFPFEYVLFISQYFGSFATCSLLTRYMAIPLIKIISEKELSVKVPLDISYEKAMILGEHIAFLLLLPISISWLAGNFVVIDWMNVLALLMANLISLGFLPSICFLVCVIEVGVFPLRLGVLKKVYQYIGYTSLVLGIISFSIYLFNETTLGLLAFFQVLCSLIGIICGVSIIESPTDKFNIHSKGNMCARMIH